MPNYPYYTVQTGGVAPATVQLDIYPSDTGLDEQDVVDAVRAVLEALPGAPTVTATFHTVAHTDI
ncbi:hypothetical protein [Streptomyces sp. S.PB5]|uniref:hypothetical protein n=1 Tax=Streptomyces sp. S.PB5 TaxID=3020844 RepID=UPI0025B052E5|nr:hypothetical protein [Streptomyces sp. S.PB5]MDN3021530.1 hypothetical protein [Streptomyces sp. S.PB5]